MSVVAFVSEVLWSALATALVLAFIWMLSDALGRRRKAHGRVPFLDAAWEHARRFVEASLRLVTAGRARRPRHRRAGAARWSR